MSRHAEQAKYHGLRDHAEAKEAPLAGLPSYAELQKSLEGVHAALLVVLDCVDYTRGACSVTEMVGAVLPKEVIAKAREALAK